MVASFKRDLGVLDLVSFLLLKRKYKPMNFTGIQIS